MIVFSTFALENVSGKFIINLIFSLNQTLSDLRSLPDVSSLMFLLQMLPVIIKDVFMSKSLPIPLVTGTI